MIGVGATVSGLIPTRIVDEQTVADAAEIVATGIRRRSLAGRSYTGRAFKPYSAAYIKSGATSASLPDLRVTGLLLRTIERVQAGTVATLTAEAPYAERVNRLRPFMGAAKEDSAAIESAANARASAIVDRGAR